ncbi:hypothetical protein RSO01_82210 [Reyranella soli]|uniref:Uncharacterized protein n=1 Tax=Reyranella soli TaxID=1230389 RepID=A0A512NQ33_9HYPH|nr:hypothetical protein RSO01_82210 [Reyranella soli]
MRRSVAFNGLIDIGGVPLGENLPQVHGDPCQGDGCGFYLEGDDAALEKVHWDAPRGDPLARAGPLL